jgi:hypothetical protein
MALSFRPYFEGIIERLIKQEILHPLDFSDTEYCIDCIKGKYFKQIKEGAKQSARVFEIIHTNFVVYFL